MARKVRVLNNWIKLNEHRKNRLEVLHLYDNVGELTIGATNRNRYNGELEYTPVLQELVISSTMHLNFEYFFVNKNSMDNRLCVRNLQIICFPERVLGWAMILCILHKDGMSSWTKIKFIVSEVSCFVPMSPVPMSLVPRLSAPVPWIY